MQDAFDLTELTAYLTQLAQAQGFLVDEVRIYDETQSKGDLYIQVVLLNTSKSPPVSTKFEVSVREVERVGVHAVDKLMAYACSNLSAL